MHIGEAVLGWLEWVSPALVDSKLMGLDCITGLRCGLLLLLMYRSAIPVSQRRTLRAWLVLSSSMLAHLGGIS